MWKREFRNDASNTQQESEMGNKRTTMTFKIARKAYNLGASFESKCAAKSAEKQRIVDAANFSYRLQNISDTAVAAYQQMIEKPRTENAKLCSFSQGVKHGQDEGRARGRLEGFDDGLKFVRDCVERGNLPANFHPRSASDHWFAGFMSAW
jgi:hypothetical protein